MDEDDDDDVEDELVALEEEDDELTLELEEEEETLVQELEFRDQNKIIKPQGRRNKCTALSTQNIARMSSSYFIIFWVQLHLSKNLRISSSNLSKFLIFFFLARKEKS